MLFTKTKLLISVISLGFVLSCRDNSKTTIVNIPESTAVIPLIDYSVPNYYPHDTTLFTEGFLFYKGQLFESTGSPKELWQAKSLIGISDLATGKFSKKIELDEGKYFGEGISFLGNKLYQLTYTTHVGFIYDATSFKKTGEFKYDNEEGWSLTTDGKYLIMSDGTSKLTFIDPVDLKPARVLNVTENGVPRDSLNELEYIRGFIYANVWMNNFIYKINPATGQVVGKLNLSVLTTDARNKNPRADVLNGIAYDSINNKVYVTGKLWPNIYQLNFNY
jgi:glutaminyl-peptide cyclotransferase